jgi:hypothetical protein
LSSEIARVLREVDVIEGRALARWHALPPSTLTGQPPILQDTGTEAIETLGELMLYDKNISPNRKEENQIVAFLETLSDGFTRPYPNSDTFTGVCMTGGSAATQGNEFLIPTPPLPPCASTICGVAPVLGPKSMNGNLPAQESPTTSKAARARIIRGPMIALSKEHLTVIRWTTNNPGGSPVHYGVVITVRTPGNLAGPRDLQSG